MNSKHYNKSIIISLIIIISALVLYHILRRQRVKTDRTYVDTSESFLPTAAAIAELPVREGHEETVQQQLQQYVEPLVSKQKEITSKTSVENIKAKKIIGKPEASTQQKKLSNNIHKKSRKQRSEQPVFIPAKDTLTKRVNDVDKPTKVTMPEPTVNQKDQDKKLCRHVICTNNITKKMTGYRKFGKTWHPDEYRLMCNGIEIAEGESLDLKLEKDTCTFSFFYDFRPMGSSYKKGTEEVRYTIPKNAQKLDVGFSWYENPTIIIKSS